MNEINEQAPPSDRREAIIDRMKFHLKNLLRYFPVGEAEKKFHFIEEIEVSGDDSLEELIRKILQSISETETRTLEPYLLRALEKTITELYPELWVVHVHGMGIVIADSVWESKFAPNVNSSFPKFDAGLILQDYLYQIYLGQVKNHKWLQVYTDIDVERCFVKWQEDERKLKPLQRQLPKEVKELHRQPDEEYEDAKLVERMCKAGIDNNGSIDYCELPAATLHLNKMEGGEDLAAAFAYFDKDDSGHISSDELLHAFRDFSLRYHPDEMIKEIDQYNEEKKNRHSHPPNHVVKIDDNGVLKVDKGKKKSLNIFLKFYGNRLFRSHSTDLTLCVALYGLLWTQLSALGNPLDKLSQSTGIDPMELSMGKACSSPVWASLFFLNIIYAAVHISSLPFRIPAYALLGFSLLYYILEIIVATSGYSVSWGGSAKISGLLFVFVGATGLVLLLSIIIMGVLYAAWCSSLNDVGGELNEKHSPECIITIQDT